MGASGWDYRVPYAGSVEATLAAVQEQVLASGDYIWPWEASQWHDAAIEVLPRPSSLADLTAAKDIDDFWDEGTHTILDIDRIITDSAEDNQVGAILPLSPAELNQVFGSEQPSGADFDRAYEPGLAGPLGNLHGERWTGRSVVIYEDGVPAEVYFWGFSGD